MLSNFIENIGLNEDQVKVAGVVQDWESGENGNSDSIVFAGFEPDSAVTVHVEENAAAVMVNNQDSNDENETYTAAILMPEYGSFDSDDMELINNAVHKI